MARPSSERREASEVSSLEMNPSRTATSGGGGDSTSRVSGSSMEASRESTVLMVNCLTRSRSSPLRGPFKTITLAEAMGGRRPWVRICTHWAAESAR